MKVMNTLAARIKTEIYLPSTCACQENLFLVDPQLLMSAELLVDPRNRYEVSWRIDFFMFQASLELLRKYRYELAWCSMKRLRAAGSLRSDPRSTNVSWLQRRTTGDSRIK